MKGMMKRIVSILLVQVIVWTSGGLSTLAATEDMSLNDEASELQPLGADDGIKEMTHSGGSSSATIFSDRVRVKNGIDLTGAVYMKVNTALSGDYYGEGYWADTYLYVTDSTTGSNRFSTVHHFDQYMDGTISRTETFRASSEAGFSKMKVNIDLEVTDAPFKGSVSYRVTSVILGYPNYSFRINSDYNGMGSYRERIYTGENEYTEGNTVKYPRPYFTDGSGKHVSELGFSLGRTVSPQIWEGGGTNSLGVTADAKTLEFKGFRLAKPGNTGALSGYLPSSFTFDNSFKSKYREYMSSNGVFELVPVYVPKTETVWFFNDYATVGGKQDVKGVYDGFRSEREPDYTMLDTLMVKAKANASYNVSHMVLWKPTGGKRGKWTGWKVVQDNANTDDKTTLKIPLNYETEGCGYSCVGIYYDTASSPSITVTPNPKSVTKGTDCYFLYLDGPGAKEHASYNVDMEAGSTLDIDKAIVREPYTFAAMPNEGYHAYWRDGTLDSNYDGLSDMKIPGYRPFKTTYGDQFMNILNIPVKSRIYYNFVHDVAVPDTIEPQDLCGYLRVRDKLLLTGKETTRGLNGIQVFSNGVSCETKKGSYSNVTKEDGYYVLESNDDFKFYDLYSYNVTFHGEKGQEPVAAMLSQSPNELGEITLDATEDVDISDAKLLIQKDGAYAVVDTRAAADGYYLMDGGSHNYRLRMTAARAGENLTRGVLTFTNKNGKKVTIEGTNGATHGSEFTFDFDPKAKGILAGATAMVTFYAGERAFLSRDTGLKAADGVGVLTITNSLTTGNLKAYGAEEAGAPGVDSAEAYYSLLDSLEQIPDLGWSGDFEPLSEGDVTLYDDYSDRVIRIGFNRDILSSTGEKHLIMDAATAAAEADEEYAKEAAGILKLKESLAAAEDKTAVSPEIADRESVLADRERTAQTKWDALYEMLTGIWEPETRTVQTDTGLVTQADYSALITFGYESESGRWYLKEMLQILDMTADSSVNLRLDTPVGAETDILARLKVHGNRAVFVAKETEGKRCYITDDNKDGFDMNEAVKHMDSHGMLWFAPGLSLTGNADIAGGMAGVEVNGRAEAGLAYGYGDEGVSSSAMNASFKVRTMNLTAHEPLTEGTVTSGSSDPVALGSGWEDFLEESADRLKAQDVSYMEYEAVPEDTGEEVTSLGAVDYGGREFYEEKQLMNRIAPDADFDMVSLGDGRYAAVFLNVPRDRIKDAENSEAVYYALYDDQDKDGVWEWSEPVLIEEDGILDQYPRIYEAEGMGALILWSSVDEEHKDDPDSIDRLNALELHGRFVDREGKLYDDIIKITEDEADFLMADRALGVVRDGDGLAVVYEKRRYEAGGQDGATVRDLLYPASSLMATRVYDPDKKEWGKPTVHDCLPGVSLTDDLDPETGFYREGGDGTLAEKLADPENVMLLEGCAAAAVIGGSTTGLIAYTVDEDGDQSTSSDRELILATYDAGSDTMSEPIILTGYVTAPETGKPLGWEDSNPGFVSTDNGVYLTWLRNGEVAALDVGRLLSGEDSPVKSGTTDGVNYRYTDKTFRAGDGGYEPPTLLVSGSVRSFDAESDGTYIYVLWPGAAADRPATQEDNLDDIQLWGVRAKADAEGLNDVTKPVQITSFYGQKYDDIAFKATEGKLLGLTRKVPSRMITASEARAVYGSGYDEATFVPYAVWDDTGAVPASFTLNTVGTARIVNAEFTKALAGDTAEFYFEVCNDGFDNLSGVTATARDVSGNSVLYQRAVTDDDETDGTMIPTEGISLDGLGGGETVTLFGQLPPGEEASEAKVILSVAESNGAEDELMLQFGQRVELECRLNADVVLRDALISPTGERNRYEVTAGMVNEGSARAGAGKISLTARTDDRTDTVCEIEYPSLMPGEAYEIDEIIEVTDEDFVQTTEEDGTVSDELKLFAEYDGRYTGVRIPVYAVTYHQDADTDRSFISRTARAEEAEEISHVTGIKAEAVKGIYDELGDLTGGETVSEGPGRITLEAGETVDLQVEILSDLTESGTGDGNVLDIRTTGIENLTSRYEYIGDNARIEPNGMLHALKEGSGRIRVYVHPDSGYALRKASDDETGTIREEDDFYTCPGAVVKTFILDVDILGEGERNGTSEFTDGNGIIYRIISGSEVSVVGLDGSKVKNASKLVIPDTIKDNGQIYRVTRIEANAFGGNGTLKQVTLGKNLTVIGDGAFRDCASLEKLTIGSGLEQIGEEAFRGCGALKSVTLPAKLSTLGDRAFFGCSSLRTITIRSEALTVEGLGKDIFGGVPQDADIRLGMRDKDVKDMLNLALAGDKETFTDRKGIIYEIASSGDRTLTAVGLSEEAAARLKSLSIPASVKHKGYSYRVTAIGDSAFTGNGRLTKVTLPVTLETIGDSAFAGCGALKSMIIPRAVTSIGTEAFINCVNLTSVTVKSPGLTVGDGAFEGVPDTARFKYGFKGEDNRKKLAAQLLVTGDDFVTRDGLRYRILNREARGALLMGSTDKSIKKLVVPDTVEYRGAKLLPVTVEDGAFAYHDSLKTAVFGKNLFSIGPDAFAGCTSLKSLTFKGGEIIFYSAFTGCTSLTSITLPKELRSIGSRAFDGCVNLKTITFKSTVMEDIGADAFGGIHPEAVIRIQKTSEEIRENIRELLLESGVDEGCIR